MLYMSLKKRKNIMSKKIITSELFFKEVIKKPWKWMMVVFFGFAFLMMMINAIGANYL